MTMKKEDLIVKTAEWARERGLHKGCYQMQVLKLAEELGELIGAHLKLKKGPNDKWRQVQKDSVGDMLIVMGVTRAILIEAGRTMEYRPAPREKELNVMPFASKLEPWTACAKKTGEFALFEIMSDIGRVNFFCEESLNFILESIWNELQEYCIGERLDILECWELAYNEVAQRKGKTIGGVFVKDGD